MRPADADERSSGVPEEVALANARLKATAVARPGERVLGVDTVVALHGEVFGKPRDAAHATETLERLQGRAHRVISGLVLLPEGERVVTTEVRFRPLDAGQIARYVSFGEWQGRAGGYAIQERGALLVERIAGDYANVVGLPIAALLDLAPELLEPLRT